MSLPNADPILISPSLSVDAFQSPFVQVEMRCLDGATDCNNQKGQIFWKTAQNPTFNEKQ